MFCTRAKIHGGECQQKIMYMYRYGAAALALPLPPATLDADEGLGGSGGGNGRVVVFGGFDGENILSSVEIFTPEGDAACSGGYGRWIQVHMCFFVFVLCESVHWCVCASKDLHILRDALLCSCIDALFYTLAVHARTSFCTRT